MDISAKAGRRIVAAWLPRLSTDRLQRKQKTSGGPVNSPLVVADKLANALRLTAVDGQAAQLGLKPGMALADARARIPSLTVAQADPAADFKLLEAVAAGCERFTPLVAVDLPQTLFLDVTGVTHLFGGDAGILDAVRNFVTHQNISIRAAIAGTADAARALAQFADGAIAPAGQDAQAVGALPVEALGVDHAIIHALKRAGLKTIGSVAGRGRDELRARFGSEFVFTLDCALGAAERPIAPRPFTPDVVAERAFADPVVSDSAISEALRLLAVSLAKMMERSGEGARRFEASFFRADGEMRRIAVETADPTRNAAIVELLFREKLDALSDPLDAGFGFDVIRLSATFLQPANTQNPGLGAKDEGREIRALADRLTARFGGERVLVLQAQDTHIPEAECVALPAQKSLQAKTAWPAEQSDDGPYRPLRLFRRPEPIDAMAEIPDGPPLRFRWRNALHHVVLADGPERIAPEWWRTSDDAATRDYFRVQDSSGRRYWIFRAGLYGREPGPPRWYMHGSFA